MMRTKRHEEEAEEKDVASSATSSSSLSSFDYIIVGAGSTAMGLLAGLLENHQLMLLEGHNNFLDVAIVERGGSLSCNDSSNSASTAATATATAEKHHHDNDNEYLSRWYEEAHFSSKSAVRLTGGVHNTSGRRRRRHRRRTVTIPTGCGLGGTSRIHAGLCFPAASDDFVNWPHPWQTQLHQSTQHIYNLFFKHGALHRYTPGRQHGQRPSPEEEYCPTDYPSTCTSIPCTGRASGRRVNYYEGLVQPLLLQSSFTKLHWLMQATVQRLLVCDDDDKATTTTSSQSPSSSSRRCIGIEYWDDITKTLRTLYAKQEVIVCAGVFASPALLYASGLTPTPSSNPPTIPLLHLHQQSSVSQTTHSLELAKSNEKDCLHDAPPSKQMLPRIQSTSLPLPLPPPQQEFPLLDHVMIPCVYFTWRPACLSTKLSSNGVHVLHHVQIKNSRLQIARMDAAVYPDIVPAMLVDLFLFRRGRDYCQGTTAAAWWGDWLVRCLRGLTYMCVRWTPLYWILQYHVVTVVLILMNPSAQSTSRLVVQTTSTTTSSGGLSAQKTRGCANVRLDVDLKYMASDQDVQAIKGAWSMAKHLILGRHGTSRLCWEVFPGPLVRQWFPRLWGSCSRNTMFPSDWHDQRFANFCRSFCLPYFHWCGTLPMDGSVVDADLRVSGVSKLRVCDASVFPRLVSVPPALTCAALGHALAMTLTRSSDNCSNHGRVCCTRL